MKADKAWKTYNFINDYKEGKFGEVSLQEALDEYYDSYNMRYIDKYPGCKGCPVQKYCGTMIGSIRLCNSYDSNKDR